MVIRPNYWFIMNNQVQIEQASNDDGKSNSRVFYWYFGKTISNLISIYGNVYMQLIFQVIYQTTKRPVIWTQSAQRELHDGLRGRLNVLGAIVHSAGYGQDS